MQNIFKFGFHVELFLIFGTLYMSVADCEVNNGTNSVNVTTTCPVDYVKVERILDAFIRAINYLDVVKRSGLNVDGVVGLRMAGGQLKTLINRVGPSMTSEFRHKIQNLVNLAGKTIRIAIPPIAARDPKYYSVLGAVLKDYFWDHNYPIRKANFSLVYPVIRNNPEFSEPVSDRCMSQLLGSGEFKGRPCSISDYCWNLMTSPFYGHYLLTHEILYLLIGETMNCGKEIDDMVAKSCRLKRRCQSVSQMHETFCANVLHQMMKLEAAGFPHNSPDLFIEQVAVCGILGFEEVCRPLWLKLILSWQLPSGCYARTGKPYRGEYSSGRRRKREDDVLADGCSTHKTSVAAGALGVCIRFYVEDPCLATALGPLEPRS